MSPQRWGTSRAYASKWVRRWRAEGDTGLADRSSRSHSTPHLTSAVIEAKVCRLRSERKLGPAGIGTILAGPPRPCTASFAGPV